MRVLMFGGLIFGGLVACQTSGLKDGTSSMDRDDTDTDANEVTYLTLDVQSAWNCGEVADEDTDAPNISWDEDEWGYLSSSRVVLGPIDECEKHFSERADDAVCSWDFPSTCWDQSLSLGYFRGSDGRLDESNLKLRYYGFAGDADSSASASVPVAALPFLLPWSMSVSPDNASGIWGDVSFEVRFIE